MKAAKEAQGEITPENQLVIREREIIHEIVEIRCPYCGNLYDEKRTNVLIAAARNLKWQVSNDFSRTNFISHFKY